MSSPILSADLSKQLEHTIPHQCSRLFLEARGTEKKGLEVFLSQVGKRRFDVEGQKQRLWLQAALVVTNQTQEKGPPRNLDAKIDKSVPNMILQRKELNKSKKEQQWAAQKAVESLNFLFFHRDSEIFNAYEAIRGLSLVIKYTNHSWTNQT